MILPSVDRVNTGGPGARVRRGLAWRPLLAAGLLSAAGAQAAALQDTFADRETVTDPAGRVDGNNFGATREAGEPRHGGKPGGGSVWLSWVAPADGVATFTTEGSDFDTLLSAYFLNPGDTRVDQLHEAARNDDAEGLAPVSLIQFGALAGRRYEIAVDGYQAALGNIRLRWDFLNATSPPPVIISVPEDRAARQGDPVTLTVGLITSPELDLQWRFNGDSLEEKGPTLFIPSLQPTNVGRYTLRIRIDAVRFETTPTELQINSEGQTNVLARDKLPDAFESPLLGDDGLDPGAVPGRRPGALAKSRLLPSGADPPVGVVRGYNGTQIFNTLYATSDPSEPSHCGVPGGASYWLLYQPPTNGTLVLDTKNSTYDTVLEAYTFDTPLQSYASLVSLGCDNDGAGSLGAAQLEIPVLHSRQYVVVVDGVNGARGMASLNYFLNTNTPPEAPGLLAPAGSGLAIPGASLRLAPPLTGSPPLHYTWTRDGLVLTNASGPSLLLANVTGADAGEYTLVVTNDLGQLSVSWSVRVVDPPRCDLDYSSGAALLRFPTIAGVDYRIEQAASLAGPWQSLLPPLTGDGQPRSIDLGSSQTAFYRLRLD